MNATSAPMMRVPMLIPATAPELSPLLFLLPELAPPVITGGSGRIVVKDGLVVGCRLSDLVVVVLKPVFAVDAAVVVKIVVEESSS